jgi:hypothetical protein
VRGAIASLLALLVLAPAAAAQPTPRQVERFWTPQRMAAARPLEMTVGRQGRADVHLGRRPLAATASYSVVATPEVPPYAWNGRLYVVQNGEEGFCSATAINSASRSLVLTAGHCVNTGPKHGRPGKWSTYLEFVPGYNLGAAPYGTFVLSGTPKALPLAEAVGGGATIVYGLGKKQTFETFGYPGGTERMRTCVSGFAGEDPITFGLAGPSTVSIRCRWAPGASGGAWMIDGGTEIDGINTYLRVDEKQRTFGPYFTAETVGRLVEGL